MGKDPLAGEPFKLTVGSPVPVAAPEDTRNSTVLALAVQIHLMTLETEKILTGSAGVTSFGCDISKLLDQRAEKFARLQLVLAGPLSTAGVWPNVRETQARRRDFAKPAI